MRSPPISSSRGCFKARRRSVDGLTRCRAACWPAILSAHCFYALVSYALAAYFIVAGLFQGPPAERGRFDPVSCGVLAGYLFGALLLRAGELCARRLFHRRGAVSRPAGGAWTV